MAGKVYRAKPVVKHPCPGPGCSEMMNPASLYCRSCTQKYNGKKGNKPKKPKTGPTKDQAKALDAAQFALNLAYDNWEKDHRLNPKVDTAALFARMTKGALL